ncbi:MAG: thioesterase family protein [Hyphomicrobium sp.]|uniref:thioesterase family protein n=1 Tax=Hyphomicrobium sp. TaxID=82 RepID=UPI0013217FBA|nr:thioesterase family protein [Hyphomicrobium sp.]KAB2943662.1 MAG: thioesterase [Hyphomicrobium sp.]MBZ0210638.1 thioesterase family protein [Hyphomicrobium sp.]
MDPTQDNAARLPPGRIGRATSTVSEAQTAPRLGSGRAPVYGTPAMIALIEAAAVACVESELAKGQETLGVHVDVEHIAATPVGLTVTATAELIERNGRKLLFSVVVHDEREVIGRGRHTRIIVDSARFRAKAEAKRNG